MSFGAAAGAAVAAAQREATRRRLEEETLTAYTPADLAGDWQFKILTSPFNRFKNPDYFRNTLEEEAQAGWVLVEKFDDSRVRLKRPASYAQIDAKLDFDPYRTIVGARPGDSHNRLLITLGFVAALLFLMGLLMAFAK